MADKYEEMARQMRADDASEEMIARFVAEEMEEDEFRRGKGTLNGESIHRMADFCSLVVRYAEMLALNPETRPTRKDAYGFIIDNTASQSLKELAEAARKETN